MKCPKCHSESPPDTRYCSNCGTQLIPLTQKPLSATETLQTPVVELSIGSTFAERYQIIEELGRGGMGSVYKAFDTELGEKIALKLLKPEIAADERMIERFRNELKLARRITHKNVCRMFDLAKDKRTPYITMEYVSGEDIKSSLRRMGPLSPGKAVHIARQVCDGLAEAHKLGVIHRDMKPQNVMIDKTGNARIMDFGIARSVKAKGVTTSGMMIGTPDYMSPEQVEGKPVDQRSDIYATGVILFEMLTGATPFQGETALSIAMMHVREKPPNPRDLNPQISLELSRLILKCLEKDRAKRCQSAEELNEALARLEAGMPGTDRAIPWGRPSTAKETIKRKSGMKAVLIPVFVIAALGVLAYIAWQFTPLPEVVGISPSSAKVRSIDESLRAAHQYWEEKKYQEAYSQFQKILETNPGHFEAQLGIAGILKEQEKVEESIAEFEKSLTLNRSEPRSYKSLGELYEQKDGFAKALDYYREYLRLAPQASDSGLIQQRMEDLDKKLQAAQVKPGVAVAPEKRMTAEAPTVETEKKAPPKTVRAAPETLREEKPKVDISAWLDRGVAAFNRNDFDTCIREMEEVLRRDPGNSTAANMLAAAKKRKGEIQIQQEIRNRLRIAQEAYQQSDYQSCILQAQEALKLEPGNVTALNLLSEARKRAEERGKEQQISDGLKMVQAAFQRGDYQDCLAQAKNVLSLDPDNAQAREYTRLAGEKIDEGKLRSLVNEYIQSLNTRVLPGFYQANSSRDFYEKIKKVAEVITTSYIQVQCSASNIEIKFKGADRAQASFSHTISGTDKNGVNQEIFRGVYVWDLEKQGESWKIVALTPRASK